jgi:hypothetical protein
MLPAMFRGLVRAIVLAATMLGVWLCASPAWAYVSLAAPQCDHREATTFAPAPTLQDATTSMDLGDTDPCDAFALEKRQCERGRAHGDAQGHGSPMGTLVAPPPRPRAFATGYAVNDDAAACLHAGVPMPCWRPPRR